MKRTHRTVPMLIALGILYSGIVLLTGAVIGRWAVHHSVRSQIVASLQGTFVGRMLGWSETKQIPFPVVQHLDWNAQPSLISNLHYLEVVKLKLAPFETYGEGGALAEVGGNILYASPLGQLGYLSSSNVIKTIDARVPMNLDGLRSHPIFKDPRFVMSYFRTLDLLIVPRTSSDFDLYVSHHRFGDGCFEFVISHTSGKVQGDDLEIAGTWDDLFVASPCMPTKDTDLLWGGLESGGRLALLDARTLLVTIGDHQFDGIRTPIAAAQDPKSDLGKVIAIDLTARRSRRFASGLRSPQGLLVARDGTIWETEHGPQGGDEINLIREGLNYGWPNVTYGMDYGKRPRKGWPLNPEQGRHDGYEPAAFAFVPSIAISNLIQPDPREWPRWRDHLLVSSMGGYERGGGGRLYLARVERNKQIIYAEEITIPVDVGERIRDIVSMADGRIAVLTERANLLLFRNEDKEFASVATREAGFDVTLDPNASAAVKNSQQFAQLSPAEAGRQIFASRCASCHLLNGQISAGPPLNGVVDRKIAAIDGYNYSAGMRSAGGQWTESRLREYLMALKSSMEGSQMPPAQLSYDSAMAVITYLRGL